MIVRDETAEDQGAIGTIIASAFKDHPHSRQTEAAIVDALRATGALALSLVACDRGEIIGHAAFSPVLIAGREQGWFGLGPVAVRPDEQGRGVGASLIREGLQRLKHQGAQGCVVLGEPDYYGRFGFRRLPGLWLADVPPDYFLTLPFGEAVPSGEIRYAAAFDAS